MRALIAAGDKQLAPQCAEVNRVKPREQRRR